MSEIARKLDNRRAAGRLLAALVTLVAVAALGASPAMAAGAVTIKTGFENSPISLNTSDAVGYALTNTTGVAQVVTFTDNLPAGVALDSPIGTTNTNGTGSCSLTTPTASPGGTSVTVTVSVPSATGTVCTISFGVVAGSASNDLAIADSYSNVSTVSGVVPTTTHGSLTVLANPTLSFTVPTDDQSFYLGQTADASFSCSAADPLDSIDSFFGTDDAGNQIEPGAPIDTLEPGTHTLEVDCYSAAGGGDVSQSVSYSVGSYRLGSVRAVKQTDVVSFKTLVPAGRIVAELIYGKKLIGTSSSSVTSRGTTSVSIKPKAAGMRLLAAIKAGSVRVKLQVSFTPRAIGSGDEQITPAGATVIARTIRLPLTRAATNKTGRARRERA